MTTNYVEFDLQLYDSANGVLIPGAAIIAAGGKVYVATSGDAKKATIYNPDSSYVALTNPMTPTRGKIRFAVVSTVTEVDLYIQAPNGQFRVLKGVKPGGPQDVLIDTRQLQTTMVIPFSIDDTAAATETDTGFDLPTDSGVLPFGMGIYVSTLDATEDMDVGILSSESGGDADGFMNDISVAALGYVPAKNTTTAATSETYYSSTTWGALVIDFLAGANILGDVGTANVKPYRCDGTAKSVSYTLSTGTDLAEGFIIIPLMLPAVVA